MKNINNKQFNNTQKFNSYMAPMFLPHKIENIMASQKQAYKVPAELSIFDVKELYDLAYDIKAKQGEDDKFKQVLAEAVKLDMAYRRQLADSKKRDIVKSGVNNNNAETTSDSTQVA